MIRTATVDDLPEIVSLGAEFLAAGHWGVVGLDKEAFADFAQRLIAGGVILLSDHGMLGGMVQPLYFQPSVVLGSELFWWGPKEGRELRRAFEDWCQERGASFVQFSGLVNDRTPLIDRLFERAGYARVETGYLKRF